MPDIQSALKVTQYQTIVALRQHYFVNEMLRPIANIQGRTESVDRLDYFRYYLTHYRIAQAGISKSSLTNDTSR